MQNKSNESFNSAKEYAFCFMQFCELVKKLLAFDYLLLGKFYAIFTFFVTQFLRNGLWDRGKNWIFLNMLMNCLYTKILSKFESVGVPNQGLDDMVWEIMIQLPLIELNGLKEPSAILSNFFIVVKVICLFLFVGILYTYVYSCNGISVLRFILSFSEVSLRFIVQFFIFFLLW